MKTLNVVAAIIKKDNQVLATKRGYGEFINMWEFPGGKIEPDETKEEALIREIKEELDCTIKPAKFALDLEYQYPTFYRRNSKAIGAQRRQVAYKRRTERCKLDSGGPHNYRLPKRDHGGLKWQTKDWNWQRQSLNNSGINWKKSKEHQGKRNSKSK